MNENYKFSDLNDAAKEPELNEEEIKTINRLGLIPEDLQRLVGGSPVAEGSYALIFELPNDKKTIAKVWKNPKSDAGRADHENAALRLLRLRKSQEAPRLNGYLKSSAIIFEEKIEGSPIKCYDKKSINQLAEALAKIHSIKLNAFGKPLTERIEGTQLDYLMEGIKRLRDSLSNSTGSDESIFLISKVIEKTEDLAMKKKESFQNNNFTLIHFDLNRNNILRSSSSDKIIIVDWEQASAGDNAMDIAKMFLKLNFDEEQKSCFLTEYEKGFSKKDEHFQDRLDIYEPLVAVNSVLWRLRALKNKSTQRSAESENEKQFYIQVQSGLESEIAKLNNFLNTRIE